MVLEIFNLSCPRQGVMKEVGISPAFGIYIPVLNADNLLQSEAAMYGQKGDLCDSVEH